MREHAAYRRFRPAPAGATVVGPRESVRVRADEDGQILTNSKSGAGAPWDTGPEKRANKWATVGDATGAVGRLNNSLRATLTRRHTSNFLVHQSSHRH